MIHDYTFAESLLYSSPYVIGTLLFAVLIVGLINLIGKLVDALQRKQ